jgi:DNA-directed RNA polymerase subunit RPC12/RpoP
MTSLDSVPFVWRALVAELNGVDLNTRDPANPCEAFDQTDDPDGSGECMTDGHYMCVECKLICLSALRRKRDQCQDCGAKLVFPRHGSEGECVNECHLPAYIIERRREAERAQEDKQ